MQAVTYFDIPAWGTATILEIIWTLSGLLALVFSFWGFQQAIRDHFAVVAAGRNGVMLILTKGYIRREALRIISGGVIAAIGSYSMILAGPDVVTPVGILITAGLFYLGFQIATNSVLDVYQRKIINDYFLTHSKEDIASQVANEVERRVKPQPEDV